MRTKLIESNKPDKIMNSVKNADTSPAAATIAVGTPLVLNLSATPQPATYTNGLPPGWEDGLQVVLPSTAAATNAANPNNFYYGVATGPIIYGQLGSTMLHGVAQGAFLRATRANSTANWTAVASSAASMQSVIADTVNNVLVPVGTVTGQQTVGIVLDNFPAVASSASSPNDTRIAITQLFRVFVRQF